MRSPIQVPPIEMAVLSRKAHSAMDQPLMLMVASGLRGSKREGRYERIAW